MLKKKTHSYDSKTLRDQCLQNAQVSHVPFEKLIESVASTSLPLLLSDPMCWCIFRIVHIPHVLLYHTIHTNHVVRKKKNTSIRMEESSAWSVFDNDVHPKIVLSTWASNSSWRVFVVVALRLCFQCIGLVQWRELHWTQTKSIFWWTSSFHEKVRTSESLQQTTMFPVIVTKSNLIILGNLKHLWFPVRID